jgi:CubicO group peptidase (beta-lactamase class C family)
VTGLQDAFERIARAAEDLLPRTHAPGLALAVTDREATLGAVARGFADVASGRPIRADTRFQIGSISKSFAALCVLQEEVGGTLALDVSVNELLPWLELPEPFGPITLHHLLTHSSGLMTGVEHGPWGIADAIRARSTPPTFPPGERYSYSNLGYKLVGHVLERVTGTPIHGLLHERILGPLGMTRSVGAILEEDRADAAVGYAPMRSDRPPHLQSQLGPAAWQVSNTADGSIVSTVGDLCAYARMVLARGAGLLDPDAFDRWVGPYLPTEDRAGSYGYGWNVVDTDGRRLIRHSGATVGFAGLLAIDPVEGLAVAICMNGDGRREPLGAFSLEAVAAALRGEPLPTWEPLTDAVADADELTGTYRSDERMVVLEADGGGLVLRTGPLAVRLEPWPDEADAFAVPHPALDRYLLRVERADDGRPSALTHGPARYLGEGAYAYQDVLHDASWDAFPGLYRADAPWAAAARVYLRWGRLWLTWPSEGEEFLLTPLDDGWFALGEPALPHRCRFGDVVDGLAQTIEYNGASLSRSFDG